MIVHFPTELYHKWNSWELYALPEGTKATLCGLKYTNYALFVETELPPYRLTTCEACILLKLEQNISLDDYT